MGLIVNLRFFSLAVKNIYLFFPENQNHFILLNPEKETFFLRTEGVKLSGHWYQSDKKTPQVHG